jgi:hypothetical protein
MGHIIFPTIILHGTFDAILMCINTYIGSLYNRFYDKGGTNNNTLVVSLTACIGILGVTAFSFGWFFYQNKMQILQLVKIDMNRWRYERGKFNVPNLI